jgi:cell division protein FtsW (lipid II flippase)
MHNHDNDKQSSWMIWIMVICCAVPLLFVVLFGIGGKASGAPIWIIIGGVVVMIGTHFFMMGRSRRRSDSEKDDKTHSGRGCCH